MIDFFKDYMPYLKNYRGKFIVAIIGMFLASGSTAAVAYLVKPLMDQIFVEKNVQMLYVIPVFIIFAFIGKGVGSFISSYYLTYVGEDIVRIIRDKMLAHMVNLDLKFHLRNHSGELISRLSNDISRIQGAISSDLVNFIGGIITALSLIGVVIYQSPKLALISLIIIPFTIYPIDLISKKIKFYSKKSQEQNSKVISSLSEIFNNYEMIKSYNAQEYELKKFREKNLEFFKINMKNIKNQQLLVPLFDMVGAISIVIVVIIGGREVLISHELTTGEFFSFLTALSLTFDPIRKVSSSYSKFQNAIAAHERIKDILSQKIEIVSKDKKVDVLKHIVFKNVTLSYDGSKALKGIGFEAKKGEVVGLVGDSGGGKSSVVNLLLRFYDPDSGKILLNDENIKEYDIVSLRDKISVVSQRIYIVNDTIAANVAYSKEQNEEEIVLALKRANLWEHVKSLPEGIYTVLDENGSNLSGGQKQRIAIARALYKNPYILILDEATSALDNKSEKEIMKTIYTLKDDLIVFIVAHRLSTIENADRLLVFKGGEIVCQGKIEDLKNSCDEFKRLYHI